LAFVEAANFTVRYDPTVKRFCQRKCARTKPVVAIKAVAHKLARAAGHGHAQGIDGFLGPPWRSEASSGLAPDG